MIALGTAGAWAADEVVDLGGGEEIEKNAAQFEESFKGKVFQNGTVKLTSALAERVGVYTIGLGATVNSSTQAYFNGDYEISLVEGGTYNHKGSTFSLPFRYGKAKLTMNNGKFVSTSTSGAAEGGGVVNIGYVWNNQDSSKNKDISMQASLENGSLISLSSGDLQISGSKREERTVKTSKTDFSVIGSAIKVENGQIRLSHKKDWLSDEDNSYVNVLFGKGADITCRQIYALGKYPLPKVEFNGATIRYAGSNKSFIGQDSSVPGDIYTVGADGLTVDIPLGQALVCDSNSSALKGAENGDGGIVKIGEGSITWDSITSSGSGKHLFTGPLVVSNGTWSSSLSYAATAFAVDGATSTLALSGELTAAAPDFSVTAGGTLDLVSKEPKDRTAGTLMLGENAVLKLNGGAMGVDSFSATSLDLAATAANPIKIEFTDAANISGGAYTLVAITGGGAFAAGDETKFALDANAPEGSTLSVSGSALILNVPVTNPATWTGNALDGKFSTPGNWLGNAVPGADDEIEIKATAEVELDCDLAISVKSLSIHSESARVTIGGSGAIAISGNIVNASEFRPVVNVPVEFKSGEDYTAIDVTGEVEFSGGVTGTIPVNHTTFYGNYTLKASSWDVSKAFTLAENATVSAGNTTINTSGTELLNSKAGSTLIISRLNLNVSGNIFGTFAGNLTVNYIYQYNHGGVSFNSGFSGVLRVNGIHHHSGSSVRDFAFKPDSSATIIIGGGSCGIEMQRGYFQVNGYTFHSSGNWEFDITNSNYGGDDRTGRTVIGENGIIVDTSHYDDPTLEGHTVSVNNSSDRPAHIAVIGTGGMTAIGNGTFKFNTPGTFTGGFTARDSVTLEVKSGVYPGKGNVTIKDTATFSLVQANSGTVPVAGTLTMFGGTTLRIPEFTAGVLPLSVNALAFDSVTAENKVALNIEGGALAPGFNAIIQSATALPANAWDSFAVTLGATVPDGMEPLYVVQGNTLYIVVKGENDSIWTGAGAAANFSDSANWLGGKVPADGECVHIAAAGETTLVCDIANFKPASIVFSGGAPVTIEGPGIISGIVAVTNSSPVSHTINAPVHFAGNIAVAQNARGYATRNESHITFAGGAYAAEGCSIAPWRDGYSYAVFGRYVLANTEESPYAITEYKVSSTDDIRFYVAPGSALEVPYAGAFTELDLAEGGVVTNRVVSMPEGHRLSHKNYGEYVIADEFTVSGSNKKDGYAGYNAGTGAANVFKIEKATCNKTDGYTFYFAEDYVASHGTYYFGEGGINFGSGKGYFGIGRDKDDDAQTIRPWYGDFTIETGSGNTDGFDIYFYRSVTFNTDDENGVGRKITLNARPRFNNTPTFTVSGTGKVLVNSVANNKVQPPVTVTDTATLAIKPGASLGTGTTTVNSGATLQVAESGTVTLGGGLTLADGACLGFNYTTRNAPKLDLTGKNVTLGDNKNIVVKITSENGKRAFAGKNVLTPGGKFTGVTVTLAPGAPDWVKGIDVVDGEIVLDVKPIGTKIIVR